MATWTDPTPSTSTHIRATHINELRRTVLRNRSKANLGGVTWSDGPLVTSHHHIRAAHFTELHDAMTPYLGTLNWSYGSAPVAGGTRPISVRDLTDLRNWCDQFSTGLGLPTGPDPAIQGISSKSFDPTQTPMAIIDADWVQDIANLAPGTSPLWVRTEILADGNDNLVPYYFPYQTAFQYYKNANMPVFALLTYETARAYPNNRYDNVSDQFFTNPFIDYFAARAVDFLKNVADYGVTSCMIWNEPNLGDNTLDARVFASLLYHCYTQINNLNLGLGVVMGGLLWDDTVDRTSATNEIKTYLSHMYTWLKSNNLGVPWDAVNVHVHNCGDPSGELRYGFNQQNMSDLYGDINTVFSSIDQRPVFVGEWGPNHSGAQNSPCMSNAYVYLRSTFDAMFYFEHSSSAPTCCDPNVCPDAYGATAYDYKQGTSYKDFLVTTHCTEWNQLQALLATRND